MPLINKLGWGSFCNGNSSLEGKVSFFEIVRLYAKDTGKSPFRMHSVDIGDAFGRFIEKRLSHHRC